MSAPDWLRDIAPGPQPPPVGPLPPPAPLPRDLRPRVRKGLPRVNRERQARRTPIRFGEQAERCRREPCACCGLRGQSQPHHWPTVAAGGTDRDTAPLCPACHDAFHLAGSPEAFLASHGCDLYAAIEAMRRKPDHSCERFAVLREDGTPGRERSEYVCTRCQRVLPEEQEVEGA